METVFPAASESLQSPQSPKLRRCRPLPDIAQQTPYHAAAHPVRRDSRARRDHPDAGVCKLYKFVQLRGREPVPRQTKPPPHTHILQTKPHQPIDPRPIVLLPRHRAHEYGELRDSALVHDGSTECHAARTHLTRHVYPRRSPGRQPQRSKPATTHCVQGEARARGATLAYRVSKTHALDLNSGAHQAATARVTIADSTRGTNSASCRGIATPQQLASSAGANERSALQAAFKHTYSDVIATPLMNAGETLSAAGRPSTAPTSSRLSMVRVRVPARGAQDRTLAQGRRRAGSCAPRRHLVQRPPADLP